MISPINYELGSILQYDIDQRIKNYNDVFCKPMFTLGHSSITNAARGLSLVPLMVRSPESKSCGDPYVVFHFIPEQMQTFLDIEEALNNLDETKIEFGGMLYPVWEMVIERMAASRFYPQSEVIDDNSGEKYFRGVTFRRRGVNLKPVGDEPLVTAMKHVFIKHDEAEKANVS